jgi:hypothetical protein
MILTDLCAFCDKPHLFKTQIMVGDTPVYFCSKKHRDTWMEIRPPDIRIVRLSGLIFLLFITYPGG